MAKIGEVDRRYYAVMSASELLKELIDGKTISIVEITHSSANTRYLNGHGDEPNPNDDAVTNLYVVEGDATDLSEEDLNDPLRTSPKITVNPSNLNKLDTIAGDAAFRYCRGDGSGASAQNLTVIASQGIRSILELKAGDASALDIHVKEEIGENCDIVLTVGAEDSLQQELTFAGTVRSNTTTDSADEVISATTDSETNIHTIVKTSTTQTKVTKISWELSQVKVLNGDDAQEP